MDETTACRYATSIIAVGTGSESKYIPQEVENCKKIINLIKNGFTKKATAMISSILQKFKIDHTENDLISIAEKIKIKA